MLACLSYKTPPVHSTAARILNFSTLFNVWNGLIVRVTMCLSTSITIPVPAAVALPIAISRYRSGRVC